MCIGIPMQVLESEAGYAWCDNGGRRQRVDTLLVGNQNPGTWLLVFLGAARDVLEANTAMQIRDALHALTLAGQGESVDHLFPDLVNKAPQLPDHLMAQVKGE